MSECMPIPDNWKDFVKEYSFKDIREIYTNGSWLIPTFRVEQMMEHFVKPEWISVKDRLPDKGGKYLVCGKVALSDIHGEPIQLVRFTEHKEWLTSLSVKYWMFLPELPKENNNGY